MHSGVHDHAGQLLLGNELECDGHLHGASQQFFDAVFTEQLAKTPQLRGVAGPAVLEILAARKVLPERCLAPALDDFLIAFIEGVLEIQQRHHQARGQAWAAGPRCATANDPRHWAKEVQILNLIARFDLPRPTLGQRRFDLLPGHPVGQHCQRMAQIDHLIQAVAEEFIGHGVAQKLPENGLH